jgi:hypothetical protein
MSKPSNRDVEYELMHARMVIESLQQHLRSSAKVTHEIVSALLPRESAEHAAASLHSYMLDSYWLTPFEELQAKSQAHHITTSTPC